MSTDNELIAKEKQAYEKAREELLKEHKGKYVIFKDEQAQGFYANHMEAYEAGIRKYGLDAVFLVQEVTDRPDPSISLTWQLGLLDVRE